jgi:hypothetical protein
MKPARARTLLLAALLPLQQGDQLLSAPRQAAHKQTDSSAVFSRLIFVEQH